ncbi:MAG: hypothetical protein KIT57_03640 [Blastocatellales bacterium]|nr:hypothetical protein [Blastocatellales bacterium]
MDYAAQLNLQLNQLEEREQAETTAEVSLPVPELGPDFRFVFLARRVNLSQMIVAGSLPERMALPLLEAARSGSAQVDPEQIWLGLSAEDQLRVLEFQRRTAAAVCAAPKLVESWEPREGEVSIFRLPPAIIKALYQHAMGLSPSIPVRLADGSEASIEQIESFREAS